jgi:hypothetical protein
MSLKNRVGKIERQVDGNKIPVVVAVEDGETNEQAYERFFPAGSAQPKQVIYLTVGDIEL